MLFPLFGNDGDAIADKGKNDNDGSGLYIWIHESYKL